MSNFYIQVKKIANGYLLEYPTGEKKEVDSSSMFFVIGSREERAEWYCATKKQVEEVIPKLTMEVLARVEADMKAKVD